ncbi:MAG: excalibur calcium-binding domain-containing protein [Gammaproteobacteria bacterium]|nr:excalibur calcium-binding domain-containing protein [Gammaproteobacteria bacterium]
MALVAALATFGLLVWLALRFWATPLLAELAAPVEPGLEDHAPVERLTAVQPVTEEAAGCSPNKRTCKDMVSCEEAKFYLQQCDRPRLDRDKDGVPCEKLCR